METLSYWLAFIALEGLPPYLVLEEKLSTVSPTYETHRLQQKLAWKDIPTGAIVVQMLWKKPTTL